MHGWNGLGWMYDGSFAMGLGMLFTWIIPIGLLIALVVYLAKTGSGTGKSETALEILEKAYARGEIGREEFLQKKHDLQRPGREDSGN